MKIKADIITARANPLVKWAASLSEKKNRDSSRSFIAEGRKLTLEAAASALNVTHIFLAESKREQYEEELKAAFGGAEYAETELIIVADAVFEKISTEKAPQGVISVIKYLDFFRKLDIIYKEDFLFSDSERLLALSSVRDPSNVGAVIRSAVAFGVTHIIVSSDTADVYNPKTVRSAMGSLFRVKLTSVSDMEAAVRALRDNGRRVLAAELSDKAIPLSSLPLKKSDVVVIGNEGHGIAKELSQCCDLGVYIPISKNTESLNAAVAAALFMWEQSKI